MFKKTLRPLQPVKEQMPIARAINYATMPTNLLLDELFKYSKCHTSVPPELLTQLISRISKDYELIALDCIKGEGAIVAVRNNLGDKICLKIIRPNLSKRQAFDIRNQEDMDEKLDINKYRTRLFEGLKIQRDLLKNIKRNKFNYFSIPEILGVFTQPFLYIAQEWIDGETILAYLSKINDLAKALELFKIFLDGIESNVHAYGVIHRDIKADNIMISGITREEFNLVLLDFSLAKVITRDNLTVVGEGIGTPFYADYDQLEGKQALFSTYQNDIYSLGMVLWEFITCRRIPALLSPDEVRIPERRQEYCKVLEQEIVPNILRPIFMRATAIDKDKRYQTISEFKADYIKAICEIGTIDLAQYEKRETRKYIEIDDYGETDTGTPEIIVDSIVDQQVEEFTTDLCLDCKENLPCRKYKYCNKKIDAAQELKFENVI